jgi:hypothetical protein
VNESSTRCNSLHRPPLVLRSAAVKRAFINITLQHQLACIPLGTTNSLA